MLLFLYLSQQIWHGHMLFQKISFRWVINNPDSKVHGANLGPIWGRQDPDGPHVSPMNFAIWEGTSEAWACTTASNLCSNGLIVILRTLTKTIVGTCYFWIRCFEMSIFACFVHSTWHIHSVEAEDSVCCSIGNREAGPRFNIKTVSPGIGILIIKVR